MPSMADREALQKLKIPKPREAMGPEDFLTLELLDVCQNRAPRTDYWRKDYGGEAYISGAGSQNWQPMKAAIEYWLEYCLSIDRERVDRSAIRAWLLSTFFPLMRRRFMGSEIMSLIYGTMHVGSIASIAQTAIEIKDSEVLLEALACLRCYLTIVHARRVEDQGLILVAGMRSGGHDAWIYGDPWAGRTLDIAQGNASQSGPYWQMLKRAGKGPKRAWEEGVLTACAKPLQSAVSGGFLTDGTMSGFTAITDLYVYRSQGGVATWISENRNGNTTPEIMSVYRKGEPAVGTLPGPEIENRGGKGGKGGGRANRRGMKAECRREGGSLIGEYDDREFREQLPGGKVEGVLHLKRES